MALRKTGGVLNFKHEFVKYIEDDQERVIRVPAPIVQIDKCDQDFFYAGSIFILKENERDPRDTFHHLETYMLASFLGSDNLSWLSYSGYSSGNRTLLDFTPDVSGHVAVSKKKLVKDLENFYSDIEHNFNRENMYFIDGWLEFTVD